MMKFSDKIIILPIIQLFAFLIPAVTSCPFGVDQIPYDGIYFQLYTRENRYDPDIAISKHKLEHFEHFNSSNPTIVYIDEPHVCPHKFSIGNTIKNAHLEENAYNIILVDWANPTNVDCFLMPIGKWVGNRVAEFLQAMHMNHTISLSKLHIIGFGRGAHIAADASNSLQKLGTPKIERITGLNPFASSFVKPMNGVESLNKSSATYVDMIYTAKSFSFKNEEPIGHVDFYVNYAQVQSTCNHSFCCKHDYAWKYYIDTVHNPHKYPARKCDFQPHELICSIAAGQYMGIASNSSEPGVFHVEITEGLTSSRNRN